MYVDEWIRTNGVRLHYQDWPCRAAGPAPGAPSREPVLMLHGLTQQSHTFDAVAARLTGRYRCLALDVRGRGESDWAPPDTYAFPQYVDDVLKFLDALALPAVHFLGTSMGGLIGLSLASVTPGRLRSLGLNDIGPDIDPQGAGRIATYAASVPGTFPTFDAVLAWARERYPWLAGLAPDRVTEAVRWAVRAGPDGAWRLKLDPAIGRGAVAPAPAVREAARRLWWEAYQALPCPVLLVRGAESDVLSRETADEMARRQPGLVRVEVPGVGHAPTLGEPVVLEVLDRFYGLLPDGSSHPA